MVPNQITFSFLLYSFSFYFYIINRTWIPISSKPSIASLCIYMRAFLVILFCLKAACHLSFTCQAVLSMRLSIS